MSVADVAGLIAALAFFGFVSVLAYIAVKLGRVLDETTLTIRSLSENTTPLLTEVTTTVTTANHQLGKVDGITDNVAQVSTNVSALTSLFAATLGSPVVKVAAFTYGVRQAVAGRDRRRGRR